MINSFLDFLSYEKRYSRHTTISYQTDLSQFADFLKETFDDEPTVATYNMVRSWVIHLMESKMDAISINRKIACLRSFYKFLLRQEVISKDPMEKIKILKTKKKLPQYLQENEIIGILDSRKTENSHEYWLERLILELLYGTGIRLAELIGLKDSNINLRSQTIKVLGKRNKERIIPISDSLVNLITKYREVRNREIAIGDHGHLLVTNSGDKCYPMLIHRIVKSRLGESSVEKRSPHVFRHTYATHLLNRGAELGAVKDLLGHSSLAATQVYTHNSIDKLKKVFDQAHPKA